ncbi:hypothetical protein EMIT0P44_170085 [Pseudomonas sp. IT-P44]
MIKRLQTRKSRLCSTVLVRTVQPREAFYEQSGFVPSKVERLPVALCNFVPRVLLAFWLWPTGQRLCVIFDEWLSIHSIRRWRFSRYGCAFG